MYTVKPVNNKERCVSLYKKEVLELLKSLDIQCDNKRAGSVAVAIERLRTLALQQQDYPLLQQQCTSLLSTETEFH